MRHVSGKAGTGDITGEGADSRKRSGNGESMRLKDRVTVITGASAGFGMSRGFPEGFAAEGSHLVLNYYGHPQAAMEEFRKEFAKI